MTEASRLLGVSVERVRQIASQWASTSRALSRHGLRVEPHHKVLNRIEEPGSRHVYFLREEVLELRRRREAFPGRPGSTGLPDGRRGRGELLRAARARGEMMMRPRCATCRWWTREGDSKHGDCASPERIRDLPAVAPPAETFGCVYHQAREREP